MTTDVYATLIRVRRRVLVSSAQPRVPDLSGKQQLQLDRRKGSPEGGKDDERAHLPSSHAQVQLDRRKGCSKMQREWRGTFTLTVILVLLAGASYVQGADLFITKPESPDFGTTHTLLPLIFFLITYPTYIASAMLLWKRRMNYPIAGRGAIYLLATNGVLLVSSPILTLLSMVFPGGVPCGLVFLAAATSVLPLSYCYMIRGWILVFRLEIANYLNEVKVLEIEMEKRRGSASENNGDTAEKEKRPLIDNASPSARAAVEQNRSLHLTPTTLNKTIVTTTITVTTTTVNDRTKPSRQKSLELRRFRNSEGESAASESNPLSSPMITVTRNTRRESIGDGIETISLEGVNSVSPGSVGLLEIASPTLLSGRIGSAPSVHFNSPSRPPISPIIEESGRASPWPSKGGEKYLAARKANGNTTDFSAPDEQQHANSGDEGAQSHLILITPHIQSSSASVTPLSTLPNTPDHVDMRSINGHWFITHRHLIETRWLLLFFGSLSLLFFTISLLAFLAFGDPDVAEMNREMVRQQALPIGWPKDQDYFTRAQLDPDELLYAAPCMLRNAKMIFIEFFIIGLLTPLVVWIVWRLRVNDRRTKALKARGLPEPAPATGLAHLRASHANDTDAVKSELTYVACVAFFICAAYPMFSLFAKPYILFDVLLPLAAIEVITIAHPLWVAIKLARAHRAFLLDQRQRSLGGKGDGQRKLPHHRPYFRLHFILRSSHTYPVFLRFLQKEYSSENALFIRAVRTFEKLCKTLEQRIPTWPIVGGEDDHNAGDALALPGAGKQSVYLPSTKAGGRKQSQISIGNGATAAQQQHGGGGGSTIGNTGSGSTIGLVFSPTADARGSSLQPNHTQLSRTRNHHRAAPGLGSTPASVVRVDNDSSSEDDHGDVAALAVNLQAELHVPPGLDAIMPLDEGGIVTASPPAVSSPTPDASSPNTHGGGVLDFPASSPTSRRPGASPGSHTGTPGFGPHSAGVTGSGGTNSTNSHANGTPKFKAQNQYGMMRGKDADEAGSRIGGSRVGAQTSRPTKLKVNAAMSPFNDASTTPTHQKTASSPAALHALAISLPGSTVPSPSHNPRTPPGAVSPQGSQHSTKMSRNLYSSVELKSLHDSAREVKQQALSIYSKYIRTGADFEVNIPDDLHSLVSTQIDLLRQWNPSPVDDDGSYLPLTKDTGLPSPPPFALSTLFKQASMTVFELVQKDSFRRFVLTDEFLDLLLHADEAELLKQQAEVSLEAQTRAVMEEAILKLRVKEEEAGGFHGQALLKDQRLKLHGGALRVGDDANRFGRSRDTDTEDVDGEDSDSENCTGSRHRSRRKATVLAKPSRRSGSMPLFTGASPAFGAVREPDAQGEKSTLYFLDAPPRQANHSADERVPSPHHHSSLQHPSGGGRSGNSSNPSSMPGSKRGSQDHGLPLGVQDKYHPLHQQPSPQGSPPLPEGVALDVLELQRAQKAKSRPPAIVVGHGEWSNSTHLSSHPVSSPSSATGTGGTGTTTLAKPSASRIHSIRQNVHRGKMPSTEMSPFTAPIHISRAQEEEPRETEDGDLQLVEL